MTLEVIPVPGRSPCCAGPVWELAAPAGPFRFCGRCGSGTVPSDRSERP